MHKVAESLRSCIAWRELRLMLRCFKARYKIKDWDVCFWLSLNACSIGGKVGVSTFFFMFEMDVVGRAVDNWAGTLTGDTKRLKLPTV